MDFEWMKDVGKIVAGGGIFYGISKVYRVWVERRNFSDRLKNTTEAEFRGVLINEVATLRVEVKDLTKELRTVEKEKTDLRLENGKIKSMHRNCMEEAGMLAGQVSKQETRIQELELQIRELNPGLGPASGG